MNICGRSVQIWVIVHGFDHPLFLVRSEAESLDSVWSIRLHEATRKLVIVLTAHCWKIVLVWSSRHSTCAQGLMNRFEGDSFRVRGIQSWLRWYALRRRSVKLSFHLIISGRSHRWINSVKLLIDVHDARHHAVFLQGVHLV